MLSALRLTQVSMLSALSTVCLSLGDGRARGHGCGPHLNQVTPEQSELTEQLQEPKAPSQYVRIENDTIPLAPGWPPHGTLALMSLTTISMSLRIFLPRTFLTQFTSL